MLKATDDQPVTAKTATVTANREVEVKLLAEPDALQKAVAHPQLAAALGRTRARNLDTVYYDDDAGSLQKAGIAVRVRRVYGRHIMTVKFPPSMRAGMFGRKEIEVRLASAVPDIDKFGVDVAGRIRQFCVVAQLAPAFATQIKRRTGMFQSGATKIELAVDTGSIQANGKREALDEIELELKEGSEAPLYELASALVRDHSLQLNPMTKAQRGCLLASGLSPDFCKAKVPAMPAGMVLDDYIAEVINVCLGQFVANWPAVAAGVALEGVHQARVSLRRLRAMLGLFTKVVPAPEFRIFAAEAKHIASALGPARDWDVFIDMVHAGPLGLYPHDNSFKALLAGASARRAQAYAQARKILSDPKTSCFVLDLRSFAVHRGWRNILTGSQLPVLGKPARSFCVRTMSRLHKKALRRGKHLSRLGIEERHDLRIELKKLRYAAEFSGPFFGDTKLEKRYTKAAGRLQDVLGAFNDEAVAHGLVDTLETEQRGKSNGAAVSRAAGVVLGWCGRGKVDADLGLEAGWKQFAGARHFWK